MDELFEFYHVSRKKYESCIDAIVKKRGFSKDEIATMLLKKRTLVEPGVFGIIIHWGLYSVPAFDDVDSAKRRKIKNGSEWYQNRLYKTFRVSKADEKTKNYHEENYAKPYSSFVDLFTFEKWNPKEWITLCKKAGASYIILTAKHHDGFCLWPTKTTDFAVKRDIIRELADEARKQNIEFGVYYSFMEWKRNTDRASFSIKYLSSIVIPQIRELLKYQPSMWWFDGDWIATADKWTTHKIVKMIKDKTPSALINDRLGKGNDGKYSDFRVFSDRFIPDERLRERWQHINTIGLSWGRNAQQTDEDYKSGKELLDLYEQVREKGGSFLLNLGPNSDGTLDENEISSLESFGKLLKKKYA